MVFGEQQPTSRGGGRCPAWNLARPVGRSPHIIASPRVALMRIFNLIVVAALTRPVEGLLVGRRPRSALAQCHPTSRWSRSTIRVATFVSKGGASSDELSVVEDGVGLSHATESAIENDQGAVAFRAAMGMVVVATLLLKAAVQQGYVPTVLGQPLISDQMVTVMRGKKICAARD